MAWSPRGFSERRSLRAILLLCVGILVSAVAIGGGAWAMGAGSATAAPTIASDKADYRPGETVTLTGQNWQAGEVVHIAVNDDQGQTWRHDADVTAAADGTITDRFQLPDWFIATYSVVATGPTSGTATTSFTDGNVTLHLATSEGVADMSVPFQSFGKNNAPNTNCSPPGTTPGASPKAVTAGATASIGVQSFESVLLGNVTTSTSGYVFDKWTSGTATQDSGATVTGSPTPCISGASGGVNGGVTDLYAHFRPTDTTPPQVSSINRADASPTNASSVHWTVTFSESVSGVDSGDFALVNSGLGGTPAITSVTGGGASYTVTASTGSGNGTLGLNLNDNDSITDAAGNKLGGTGTGTAGSGGTGNGSFTGQVYTLDRTAPAVTLTKVNGNVVSFPFSTNQDVSSIGGTCGTTPGDSSTVSWLVGGA